MVYIPGTAYVGITAEDGSFAITGVPEGTYSLSISKGFFTYSWQNASVNVKAGGITTVDTLTSLTTEQVNIGYAKEDSGKEDKTPATSNNVFCKATDRGIFFQTKCLNNTYPTSSRSSMNASMDFYFKEQESGVTMVRNFRTTSSHNLCDTYYPFVEAGKTYTFTVSARYGYCTIFTEEVTVKATGGLGEFKITNPDDFDVVVEDRIQKISGTPVYTNNPNVEIVDKGGNYSIYEADDNAWHFVFGTSYWESSSKNFLSLKDNSDGVFKWRSPSMINAMLSGHKYRATVELYLKIAGYQDDGQTYFFMGNKSKIGDWGGEIVKVPVFYYYGNTNIGNLPGNDMTVTIQGKQYVMKGEVVNYGTAIYEPTKIPTFNGALKSDFLGWYNERGNSKITFPYNVWPDLDSFAQDIANGTWSKITCDGVEYEAYIGVMPNFEVTYKIPVYDGDTKLGEYEFTDRTLEGYLIKPTITRDGYIFRGFYSDKDCTNSLQVIINSLPDGKIEPVEKIYSKWIPAE